MTQGSVDLIARANVHALAQLAELCRWWLPHGRRDGNEWKCGSLSGEQGSSLGVNLSTGMWKDFASGEAGGDPVSLYAAIMKVKQTDAARKILGEEWEERGPVKSGGRGDWVAQANAPKGLPVPKFKHFKHGEPIRVWEYRTAAGLVAGYVARFDLGEGVKEVLPLSWCHHTDGRAEWRWKALAEPRPLYGADLLVAEPSKSVVVVEGEKAADALRAVLGNFVVVTWSGGGKATAKTDFTLLHGRTVILWPDRDRHAYTERNAPTPQEVGTEKPWDDQPGRVTMFEVARKLEKALIFMVEPPDGVGDGWDAYDAIEEGVDVARLVAAAVPVVEDDVASSAVPPVPEFYDPRRIGRLPFQLLGCNGDRYFYLPDNGEHIVALTPSAHVKTSFFQLAPLEDWNEHFGISWDKVASDVMNRSQQLPKFDPRRIRGRGCWVDGAQVVYHAGSRLHVDGQAVPIRQFVSGSGSIYPAGLEIAVDKGEAAGDEEAENFLTFCKSLAWEHSVAGVLLAGWIATAPICGAMAWRPHIWITGPAGCGKSWIMTNVVVPMLGQSALNVQGNTSEAGLRQWLGSDALPVVFDENESENLKGQLRVESVLELARQASSETGAAILRGSAGGTGINYLIRSAFCFSSIGVAAVKRADTSRISVLQLLGSSSESEIYRREKFAKIQKLASLTSLDRGFAARIRLRSIRNAAVIRANAQTFSDVAAEFLGDKRAGDQIGALLAGAYSLKSGRLAKAETMRAWMATQDWSGWKNDPGDTDEVRCLNHLYAAQIAYDGATGKRKSVQEMIKAAYEDLTAGLDSDDFDSLLRHGIKLDREGRRVILANTHSGMEGIYRDTPWNGGKWRQQFERVPFAKKLDGTRFGSFFKGRAVSIPVEVGSGSEQAREAESEEWLAAVARI